MTNYEYYKEQIKKVTDLGLPFALDKNSKRVGVCGVCGCEDCLFNDIDAYSCNKAKFKWAYEQYSEPIVDWSKVAVDTKIWVREFTNTEWYPRYFAKYDGKNVYAWTNGATSFSRLGENDCTVWRYAKLAEQN